MIIPAPEAQSLQLRYALLADRDRFDRHTWAKVPFSPAARAGYWQLDVDGLGLSDGEYEYDLLIDQTNNGIANPYAEAITRFGGYRGRFAIRAGKLFRQPFRWDAELPAGGLPNNNEIVIYEMPLRWMDGATEGSRQVSLGTFDKALFEHLDYLENLGVNAIELLPVQDSADTLNWGYGTRFFFSPDIDMGGPVDLKFFIKNCHQRGIRILLDVVMNHARECPLQELAFDWFFLSSGSEEPGRGQDWGAKLFRYRRPAPDGHYPAREFHFSMADFWIREYHVDGFRLDEFQGIDNWEFIQQFRDHATATFRGLFPGRPFIVIAEDSWRRTDIVHPVPANPNGAKVVDAMWNFSFRDELRRLLQNRMETNWGEPSRSERVNAMLGGSRMWEDLSRSFRGGFSDLAQAVNYVTSHDVEHDGEQRLANFFLEEDLRAGGKATGFTQVKRIIDGDLNEPDLLGRAIQRIRSAFILMLTSAGIPMFLAGEEFADCHDLDYTDYRVKMSDPIDWSRRDYPRNKHLAEQVGVLIQLRTSHAALRRNELSLFYTHPEFDQPAGARVFAYCRPGVSPLGGAGQVIVIVNAAAADYPDYYFPNWPWTTMTEVAPPENSRQASVDSVTRSMRCSLAPFQARVFTA